MQNQSNREIAFDTQLKSAVIYLKLLKYKIDPVIKITIGTNERNKVFTLQSSLNNSLVWFV